MAIIRAIPRVLWPQNARQGPKTHSVSRQRPSGRNITGGAEGTAYQAKRLCRRDRHGGTSLERINPWTAKHHICDCRPSAGSAWHSCLGMDKPAKPIQSGQGPPNGRKKQPHCGRIPVTSPRRAFAGFRGARSIGTRKPENSYAIHPQEGSPPADSARRPSGLASGLTRRHAGGQLFYKFPFAAHRRHDGTFFLEFGECFVHFLTVGTKRLGHITCGYGFASFAHGLEYLFFHNRDEQ